MCNIVNNIEEAIKLIKEGEDRVIIAGAGIGEMAPDMEISFYYDKGGYMSRRGYYISVTPVKMNDHIISSLISYGRRTMVSPNEVKRKSKGNEDKARKNFTASDILYLMEIIRESKACREANLAAM